MPKQLPLFPGAKPAPTLKPSAASAIAAMNAGMANAAAGADPAWLAEAERFVKFVADNLNQFTCDDVWGAGLPKPREPRALGPVVKALAAEGYIEKVGYEPSRIRNCAPMVLWRKAGKR